VKMLTTVMNYRNRIEPQRIFRGVNWVRSAG